MKYIKQLLIILFVSFFGEIAARILPFHIPAGVYGMVIMFVCLVSGVIKLEQIEETADFLLAALPIMFIPSCVGLIDVWDKVKSNLVPIFVISIVSTVIVMVVTGFVAQTVMKKKGNKDNE